MDNLKKFTDKVQKFYASVESHEYQFQNWLKESKKPLNSIVNQSAIYRAVIPIDSVRNTPFEKFQGFRENLIENIFSSLQKEFDCLDAIRCKINSANEDLHKEQAVIENLFLDIRRKNEFNPGDVNPCCPSFALIIGWSYDIWCYYHLFYLQLSQAFFNLNFEDENSVKNLAEAFKENSELKSCINKIRSYNFSKFDFII